MIFKLFRFLIFFYSLGTVGRRIWTTEKLTLRPKSQITGYLDNKLDGDNIDFSKLKIVKIKDKEEEKIKDKEEEKTFKGRLHYYVDGYPRLKRLWDYAYGFVRKHPYEVNVLYFSVKVMALAYRIQSDRMERNRRAAEALARLIARQVLATRIERELRRRILQSEDESEIYRLQAVATRNRRTVEAEIARYRLAAEALAEGNVADSNDITIPLVIYFIVLIQKLIGYIEGN